jgi:HK97 family phage portal protein
MKFTQVLTKNIMDATRGKDGIVSKTIYSILSSRVELNSITDVDLDHPYRSTLQNPYLQNPWVAISIRILTRAMQRAPFRVYKNTGKPVTTGPLADLLRHPAPGISMAKIWAQSMQYYWTEDEFFWWFGPKYRGGMPEMIEVLRPADVELDIRNGVKRWYYTNPETAERRELKEGTFVHVYWPSLFNHHRGNPRLVSLYLQLEQDYLTSLGNTDALRNAAIPKGLLETDQRLSPDQIKAIINLWTERYGSTKGNSQIGVAAAGTKFRPLNENLIKYLEFQDQIKVATLTMYGIPLKVANATSEKTALSGKDSDEQYKAFWSQTILPELTYVSSELGSQFFMMVGFDGWYCEFDWKEIPELQVDEADEHLRIRDDTKDLLTINEGRALMHLDPVPWGDVPWSHVKVKNDAEEDPEEDPDDKKKPKDKKPKKSYDGLAMMTKKLVPAGKQIILPIQNELFEEDVNAGTH